MADATVVHFPGYPLHTTRWAGPAALSPTLTEVPAGTRKSRGDDPVPFQQLGAVRDVVPESHTLVSLPGGLMASTEADAPARSAKGVAREHPASTAVTLPPRALRLETVEDEHLTPY